MSDPKSLSHEFSKNTLGSIPFTFELNINVNFFMGYRDVQNVYYSIFQLHRYAV